MRTWMIIGSLVGALMVAASVFLGIALLGELTKPAILVVPQITLAVTTGGLGWIILVLAMGFSGLADRMEQAEAAASAEREQKRQERIAAARAART